MREGEGRARTPRSPQTHSREQRLIPPVRSLDQRPAVCLRCPGHPLGTNRAETPAVCWSPRNWRQGGSPREGAEQLCWEELASPELTLSLPRCPGLWNKPDSPLWKETQPCGGGGGSGGGPVARAPRRRAGPLGPQVCYREGTEVLGPARLSGGNSPLSSDSLHP